MMETVGRASDRMEAEIEARFIVDGENLTEVTVHKKYGIIPGRRLSI